MLSSETPNLPRDHHHWRALALLLPPLPQLRVPRARSLGALAMREERRPLEEPGGPQV